MVCRVTSRRNGGELYWASFQIHSGHEKCHCIRRADTVNSGTNQRSGSLPIQAFLFEAVAAHRKTMACSLTIRGTPKQALPQQPLFAKFFKMSHIPGKLTARKSRYRTWKPLQISGKFTEQQKFSHHFFPISVINVRPAMAWTSKRKSIN